MLPLILSIVPQELVEGLSELEAFDATLEDFLPQHVACTSAMYSENATRITEVRRETTDDN